MLGQIQWSYALSGFLVGGLVGLTGVGGGSLMTPLLVLVFGVSPLSAVGTDLLYAAATKCGGVLVHGFNGTVEWRVVRRLAAGSIPATSATILALDHLGVRDQGRHGVVSSVLGAALVLTALAILSRRHLVKWLTPRVARLGDRRLRALTIAFGAVLGVVVSVSSIGAGAAGVTVLMILYPGTPLVCLVGADIAHAVPLTLIAGLGHWYLGSVDWPVLASLLVGSLPGIAIASQLASRAPDRLLRPVLAATLAVVGVRMAF